MYRKLLLIGSAVALFALPGMAQSSQLSGTWKLNASKSNMGQMGGGGNETDVITVSGNQFTQKVTSQSQRGAQNYTRSCTINGQEEKLAADSPRAHIGPVVVSSVKCEQNGNSVVYTEGFDMRGTASTDQMTFTPSSDGNTMTMSRQISGAMSMQQKMVFDREGNSSADTSAPAANGGTASAGSHPDLSGTWNLDVAKSNFGQGQAPTSEVDTITQSGDSVKIVSAQKGGMMGDMNTTEALTTDGQSSSWSGMGNTKVNGTATWDGDKLVVNAKTSYQGSPVTIKDTYSLSPDGKTLTSVTHITSSMGNFDTTSVYDKQ
ncbi:MAG: hypothetical protein ACRD4R_01230 [Candidatus Acidiferrales bacterium]